jgi:hypothetical protein
MGDRFDRQRLEVSNSVWTIEMNYENGYAHPKTLSVSDHQYEIRIGEVGNWTCLLSLRIQNNAGVVKTCLIQGIEGGGYLYAGSDGQTVKLDENNLIISMGDAIFSINLKCVELNWKFSPDWPVVFEFYDLEDDLLLRGEILIQRLDKKGNLKWSVAGRDIWVNLDGYPEVQIEPNAIKLVDFQSNEYWVDFNGELLRENPKDK